MSNLQNHAWNEFRAAGWCDEGGNFKDEMQGVICSGILQLLDVFSDQGHSGTSGSYTLSMFNKLANFEPLVPLTGEDWEWFEYSEGRFQNRRCGRVFKDSERFNGQAYDIDSVVFWEWNEDENGELHKTHFTSSGSAQPIQFPYTPVTKYQFRPTEDHPNEVL